MPVRADDEVIDHSHAQDVAGVYQRLRRFDILAARCHRACWMVVRDDQRMSICEHRCLEYFARVHQAGGHGAVRHNVHICHLIAGVKVIGDEMLF